MNLYQLKVTFFSRANYWRRWTATAVLPSNRRFWESPAAGFPAFYIDLEKYGVDFQTIPRHWKHYIGVDLSDIEPAINRIRDEPDEWAMNKYPPRQTALRFLRELALEVWPTA